MQRHIDGQLCGIEFCARDVNYGSAKDNSKRGLTAAQLTPAPRRQAADCQGWLWTAIRSRSSAAAVWRLNIITAIPGQSLI